MEINDDTIKRLLEPSDYTFVFSEQARRAFGMRPNEFKDAVEEYRNNFAEVGVSNNSMLFHIKATALISQLNRFHRNLDDIVDMQDASGLGDMEVKIIMNQSKKVFAEGVNVLAPYAALLATGTETKNYA